MTAWTSAEVDLIRRDADLVVAPFRDDGVTMLGEGAKAATVVIARR